MSAEHLDDVWDYDRACIAHAADQGLGPPALLLNLAGYSAELWQSGGWTMVLVIEAGDAEVWVTWDGDGYIVGRYTKASLEESTEAEEYWYAGLGSLLEAVEAAVAG